MARFYALHNELHLRGLTGVCCVALPPVPALPTARQGAHQLAAAQQQRHQQQEEEPGSAVRPGFTSERGRLEGRPGEGQKLAALAGAKRTKSLEVRRGGQGRRGGGRDAAPSTKLCGVCHVKLKQELHAHSIAQHSQMHTDAHTHTCTHAHEHAQWLLALLGVARLQHMIVLVKEEGLCQALLFGSSSGSRQSVDRRGS